MEKIREITTKENLYLVGFRYLYPVWVDGRAGLSAVLGLLRLGARASARHYFLQAAPPHLP